MPKLIRKKKSRTCLIRLGRSYTVLCYYTRHGAYLSLLLHYPLNLISPLSIIYALWTYPWIVGGEDKRAANDEEIVSIMAKGK